MAGIYIHIPYCLRKCHYCDFYSTINRINENEYLEYLKNELHLVKNFLTDQKIETIYFGGGTPSLFNAIFYKQFIESLLILFPESEPKEITIEINPDDATYEKLQLYREAGINRISIGVQSFQDNELIFLNRRHSAQKAVDTIELASKAGFGNISIDLIYGIPIQTEDSWKSNLLKAFQLPILHLSAYHLSIEKGTPMHQLLQKGNFKMCDEETSLLYYNMLLSESKKAGFEHYEISNFAKEKQYSKHNSNYWNGRQYLGLGPSAHSFNQNNRRWNVSNYSEYKNCLNKNKFWYNEETLRDKDKFNEYLMTSLRTNTGISLIHIADNYGKGRVDEIIEELESFILHGKAYRIDDRIILSDAGMFVSDSIIATLFE